MLRIASYNIQKAIGADYRRRPSRTVDVLREIDADVVVLQEADRRFGARAAAVPPELIRSRTDLVPAKLAVRPLSLGWHGNAVLVRRGVRVLKSKRLVLPYLEPRGAVEVVVELDQGPLVVIGTHLALTTKWRRRQAEQLAEFAERADMPMLLCGDLNEWPSAGTGLEPLRAVFSEHAPGRTFPAIRPVAALDRFYHCGNLTLEAQVHDTPLARSASDHLPIVARAERLRTRETGPGDPPARHARPAPGKVA